MLGDTIFHNSHYKTEEKQVCRHLEIMFLPMRGFEECGCYIPSLFISQHPIQDKSYVYVLFSPIATQDWEHLGVRDVDTSVTVISNYNFVTFQFDLVLLVLYINRESEWQRVDLDTCQKSIKYTTFP